MKTIKLYDIDSFINEFTAQVVSSEKSSQGYETVLTQTAFFPEGGGQPADKGKIGDAEVLDVKISDGVITHITDRALSGSVKGVLDWERRFERMQNHSGEHIVSGLVHKYTGFDNISFQLNDEEVSLAFSGELNEKLIKQIEIKANEAVFKNVKITAFYPAKEALENMSYRSKLDLKDDVRIVEIEGYDACACCAPHCKSTAQIGLIKILDSEKYRGGTRLKIQCGFSALRDYEKRLAEVKKVSHILSAKQNEIGSAVRRLSEENAALKANLTSYKIRALKEASEKVEETQGSAVFNTEFSGDEMRKFADEIKSKISGITVAVHGDDESGYEYVLCSATEDITPIVATANRELNGRGGGRNNMARGTFGAKFEEIKNFFESR